MTRFECPHCEANCAEKLSALKDNLYQRSLEIIEIRKNSKKEIMQLYACIVDLADDVKSGREALDLEIRPCERKHAETIKQAREAKFYNSTSEENKP